MKHFNYIGGFDVPGHCICIKQELAWSTDKWLQVINNIILHI